MEIKMTEKQFRRLLDLVYIGNWILNSTRGDDRIRQYLKEDGVLIGHDGLVDAALGKGL